MGKANTLRTLALAGLCAAALWVPALAGEFGTAEEARVMLEKAVAAVKADKTEALAMFNSPEGGFRDRDLYVFCVNASDGVETAHPTHQGLKLREMKDVNGFAFGEAIMTTAKDGQISEVAYLWPRPNSDTPVKKITFVTKVDDQICGVGYYP
jgi:signal transduction histidine kinase